MTTRRQAASSLSIVLPCLDEADRLPGTLAAYLAHFPPSRAEVELIVVDDGSTDGTSAIADQIAAADPRVRVVRTPRNHGKGYAVRVGVQAAQGELVVFTDADGSYGPDQLERVVAALDRAPVAIGARLGAQQPGAGSLLRRLASPVFNRVMRLLLGLPFSDTQCGLKGFRRGAAEAVFRRARVDGFAFDAEALLVAGRLGLEVVEVPVTAEERQGSKVRLRGDALRMLADVWKVRRAAASGVYDETRVRDVGG
jgi:dolichyl-phosphate beta-glucosyltransferase